MILIPFFTQKTWSQLSPTCTWIFSGLKQMAEKIFTIPLFSHSQQFTQCSTGPCADAKGQEEPGEPELGDVVRVLCRKYRLPGSAGQPGAGSLGADFKRGMEPVRSNRGNDRRSLRNSIGKPWRRIKEGQTYFSSFLSSRRVFLFSSDSTKLERIKLSVLLVWQVYVYHN